VSGALRSNFKVKEGNPNASSQMDARAEFEKIVVRAGAKGSFMVFRLRGEEEVFVKSTE